MDLTVRGGGIFGLSIAWEAARRGARVRLIETAQIGAGSSGGLVGALSPHAPEQWTPAKAFQLQSLLMAAEFWAGVDAASGQSSGYGRTGRLQPVADETALARAKQRGQSAADLWQGQAQWTLVPADGQPFAPYSPSGWLIHDTLAARLHPRHALQSLTAALQSAGVQVLQGQEADDEGLVLWATGAAGLADIGQSLGRVVGSGVKGQAASLACPGFETAPQIFADSLHIVPHQDGSIAIGSTSETTWDTPDTTDAALETLIAKARHLMPALTDAPVIARWAGLRPKAKSRQPILGPYPGRPGQFIANGGFKIGFGIAPWVAQVMVDLMLDNRDAIPADFRPDWTA